MFRKHIALVTLAIAIPGILLAQAPRSYNSSEMLLQLRKLNTLGSVLYIAAHPDDENTRLIAYLANEKCLRTGYLSLTRGDGGQNLIGPEQGIELGVVRTQELLAARRIDGGEQFFTRAYDFGFSKTPQETFSKWNRDSVLSDMVWVIRNFRPDIIITRFATDGSGGHGHHTASALLAEEAFDAAADPKRFPEQLAFVEVWKTCRMFHNSTARFFNPNADLSHLIKLDVGGFNALLGKSYGEIAAESRSMHRSQGFGSAKQRGESFEYFRPVKGDTAGLNDIFQGMDFSWKRARGGEAIHSSINAIIKYYFQRPWKVSELFGPLYNNKTFMEQHPYHVAMLNNVLTHSLGIYFEETSDKAQVSTGDSVTVTSVLLNRSDEPVSKLPGGTDPFYNNYNDSGFLLKKNVPYARKPRYLAYLREQNSSLYWLRKPVRNDLFDYDPRQPEEPGTDPLEGTVEIVPAKKQKLLLPAKLAYKWVDPSKGELYQPVVITPPLLINMESESIVFADSSAKKVTVTVRAGKDKVKANLKFALPDGWKINQNPQGSAGMNVLEVQNVELDKKGKEQQVELSLTPPQSATQATLRVTATVDGVEYNRGIKEIKYDHIPVQTLFPEAESKLVKLDIIKKSKRLGYMPGAGDEVQQCLTQLGYEVVTITDEMLAKGDLAGFEAIITGVRAYNTNDKLTIHKQRLMDYVTNGGNLVVQYNTNSFAGPFRGDIGPYPFKLTRDRVTDEHAKVNFDIPSHPVLNTPNQITEKDFEGWIQERCIYSASDSTGKYEMPISMADAGEKPNKGSLIITKHGKGYFVYTGLVFFRELPAGVPGAYRLFVNLVELGK